MRELLYLKDDQLKEFIEKLFIGYRESFSDAKKTLDKYSIGIAHHKVIHLLSIYKGITISELLKKLKEQTNLLSQYMDGRRQYHLKAFLLLCLLDCYYQVYVTPKYEELPSRQLKKVSSNVN